MLFSFVGGIFEVIKYKEIGVMVVLGDIDGIGESLISLIEFFDERV